MTTTSGNIAAVVRPLGKPMKRQVQSGAVYDIDVFRPVRRKKKKKKRVYELISTGGQVIMERMKSDEEILGDLRLRFPSGVRIKLEAVHPIGGKLEEGTKDEIKALAKAWKAYSTKVEKKTSNVLRSWGDNHVGLCKKVDEAFKKFSGGGGTVRDLDALVVRMKRAEESLYY